MQTCKPATASCCRGVSRLRSPAPFRRDQHQQRRSLVIRGAGAPSTIVDDLIELTADTNRGANTSPQQQERILKAVDALEKAQAGRPTTGRNVDATWRLLWSTEQVLLC